MLISDQRMPSMLGVDVLARCREIYPIAGRVLLTAYSDVKAAVRAINEAHLDHYLEKPWDPPEEHLFPAIDELLGSWQAEYRPELTGLRLLGHQWSPRSHEVKDFLASNLIPYRWLDVQRDPDARRLMEATEVAAHELPALLLENGTILRNPDRRHTICMTSSSWERDRQDWPRRSAARLRECGLCCWMNAGREDKPRPVRRLKIISDSRQA